MHERDGGGSAGDHDYAVFVGDLYDQLNRFAQLYIDKTSTTRSSMYEIPPSREQVEARSDISEYVNFMLGARSTNKLTDAISADNELIENLEHMPDSGDEIAGSRIETALGYINHGLETWEGQDATQFHTYLGSVRLALHRQEALISALHALADVHQRIVDTARTDVLDLLRNANEALANRGTVSGATVLTLLGATFGLAATIATGGAGIALGVASTIAGTAASLSDSSEDTDGDYAYSFDGDSDAIRDRTIELLGELETDLQSKCGELRCAVTSLRGIFSSGGADISAAELLPLQPDVYDNGDPARFKLPVYVEAKR